MSHLKMRHMGAKALLGITCAGAALSAHAHHGMDGELPNTAVLGLLSGLAHPIIGIDHLAFIVAAAWLIARLPTAARAGLAAAFVVASVLGTVLHLQSINLPGVELLIALSVVGAGAWVSTRKGAPQQLLWAALPAVGIFHGYAYGESIVGAENSAVMAYLLGFVIIQWAVMFGVSTLLSKMEAPRFARGALTAGSLIAVVGLWFGMGHTAQFLA